jgi:hypothetical protein
MVEISRKKLRHLQPVIDNSKSVEPTRMDDQPIRHLIAAGMLGIYAGQKARLLTMAVLTSCFRPLNALGLLFTQMTFSQAIF